MMIFSDPRDPICNSRDPNRVPKTPLKNPDFMQNVDSYIVKKNRRKIKINIFINNFVGSVFIRGSPCLLC